MELSQFVTLVRPLAGLFSRRNARNVRVQNLELLDKYQNFYEDKKYLQTKVLAQLNACVYGNGRVVPEEFVLYAMRHRNPSFSLDVFKHVWNYLEFPKEGGVRVAKLVNTSRKRRLWGFAMSLICSSSFLFAVFSSIQLLFDVTSNPKDLNIFFSSFFILASVAIFFISLLISQKIDFLKQLIDMTSLE